MKTHVLTFVIPGTPISARGDNENNPDYKFWNNRKLQKLNYRLSIQRQYEKQINHNESKYDSAPLNGQVELIIQFFLDPKSKNFCEYPPKLSDLQRFVEQMCSNLIFKNCYKIIKTTAEKQCSIEPKTVIKIIIKSEEIREKKYRPIT